MPHCTSSASYQQPVRQADGDRPRNRRLNLRPALCSKIESSRAMGSETHEGATTLETRTARRRARTHARVRGTLAQTTRARTRHLDAEHCEVFVRLGANELGIAAMRRAASDRSEQRWTEAPTSSRSVPRPRSLSTPPAHTNSQKRVRRFALPVVHDAAVRLGFTK